MLKTTVSSNNILKKKYIIFLALLLLIAIGIITSHRSYSASIGSRNLQISDSKVSATTNYKLQFNTVTASNIGSIKIQFCANDPLISSPCVAPNGFSAGVAVLNNQSGLTGFSISNVSTNNEIVLTRVSSLANPTSVQYLFSGIVNPSSSGSYYVRLTTFSSTDSSGPYVDYGGLAFAITNPITVGAVVPPYLTFCSGVSIINLDCSTTQGDFIDLGELSSFSPRTGTSQILVTTNAELGYTVTVQGVSMSSGINTITPLAFNDISRPGTLQFGFNLRANNAPQVGNDPVGPGVAQPTFNYNQPNLYRFVDGEQIVSSVGPDTPKLFTISYIVNISNNAAAGVYASTMNYICLADF